MADTAAAQLKRILTVIPRFADDEEHPIADIAAAAGTTPQQMWKDIVSITERFDTPGFVESVQVLLGTDTVSLRASEFPRPMRLTMPELCALELGLVMLRLERSPADHSAIDRALTRLRSTITQLPTNDQHASLRHATLSASVNAPHLAEHLSVLRRAVREHRAVRLHYRAGGATESTVREVCPHAVVYAEHMWYIVTVGDDGGLRHFRLDRIAEVVVLEACFEPDSAIMDRVMQAGRAFASDTAQRMTVWYSPLIARWVAEREGATLADDGSLTLEHPVADESWAVRHVLQYGPEAEVLEPASMRSAVRARLEAIAGG